MSNKCGLDGNQSCGRGWRGVFGCRGFSLMLPMAVVFGYYAWLSQTAAGPSNAVISECVKAAVTAGDDAALCVGKFATPCLANPNNRHPEDQAECLQREFVLWDVMMQKAYKTLWHALPNEDARSKLKEAQSLWKKYLNTNCRLPYALFNAKTARTQGPFCSIKATALRALALRDWRETLKRM